MSFWHRPLLVSEMMVGVTGGAAGWIIGASVNLDSAGRPAEANLVWLCIAGVFVTGGFLWLLLVMGRKLPLLLVAEVLLASSFIFGVLALWLLHLRGVLALALDPAGRYPEWLAWAAPLVLLVIMAVMWWESVRRRRRKLAGGDHIEP